jgi:hypothetical protein
MCLAVAAKLPLVELGLRRGCEVVDHRRIVSPGAGIWLPLSACESPDELLMTTAIVDVAVNTIVSPHFWFAFDVEHGLLRCVGPHWTPTP